jgi:hypothetical protein
VLFLPSATLTATWLRGSATPGGFAIVALTVVRRVAGESELPLPPSEPSQVRTTLCLNFSAVLLESGTCTGLSVAY